MCLSVLCCVGQEACSTMCAFFNCCCKMSMKQEVRLGHICLNVTFFLFAIFILHYIQNALDYFSVFIHCPTEAGGTLDCLGVSSVYRVSFSLAVLYTIILIAMLFRNQCSKIFNEGLWLLKVLVVLGIFIAFMYVDYHFFNTYRDFAKVFGALFLIIQSVMLIDLFYIWGQKWKAIYDRGIEWMGGVLIITAMILYGLCITLIVLNFAWFAGCGVNLFINIVNALIIVVSTAVQVLGYNPQGSLITTGGMGLYMTFLTFSAQLSGESSCNSVIDIESIFTMEMCFGFLLLTIVLLYLTFSSNQYSPKRMFLAQHQNQSGNAQANREYELEKQNQENDSDEDDEELHNSKRDQLNKISSQNIQQMSPEERQYQKWLNTDKGLRPYVYSNTFLIFHLVMLISSVYGCMLLTNWGAPDMTATTFNMYQPSQSSYWIKIISAWSTSLLYIWTLIAPSIFPDRNFS